MLRIAGNPLRAAVKQPGALTASDMVFIATPTNYDEGLHRFDIHSILNILDAVVRECPEAIVVIRSTMQPGTTDALATEYNIERMLYCPEFLREGSSFNDCLHPSRLVIGANDKELADRYRALLESAYTSLNAIVPQIINCTTKEAEAAKLFANTYLATRVAFFNELDSFALAEGLDAGHIISAISSDDRIGDFYNNPSFGYGGYCLPKDSKALLSSMKASPHSLIAGTIASNDNRKRFLANTVMELSPTRVGIHRLVAKHGSDNLRSSAMAGVVDELVERGASVLVYEPMLHSRSYHGASVTDDLTELLESCDIILANRRSSELDGYAGTVFTRDLFTRD